MKLISYLETKRGEAARIARELGIPPARISQMAHGIRPVPPALVPAIVRLTGRKVREWDLAPEWRQIWPDLVGDPDAPFIPAVSANETATEAADVRRAA